MRRRAEHEGRERRDLGRSGRSSAAPRQRGESLASLDPHFVTAANEDAIISDMLVGLTTQDAGGTAIPGAAERWETSADGRTWTFHLRDHLWSDGKPVTANDFVYAWRRMLDPNTAAPYASILYAFKNAQAVNSGKMASDATRRARNRR